MYQILLQKEALAAAILRFVGQERLLTPPSGGRIQPNGTGELRVGSDGRPVFVPAPSARSPFHPENRRNLPANFADYAKADVRRAIMIAAGVLDPAAAAVPVGVIPVLDLLAPEDQEALRAAWRAQQQQILAQLVAAMPEVVTVATSGKKARILP
jgi:hypothetical protein